MKAKCNKGLLLVVSVFFLLSLLGLFFYEKTKASGLDVNCSSLIRYSHKDQDFISIVEMKFRLDKNYVGKAIVAGQIKRGEVILTISRSIIFHYEIVSPSEILVSKVIYVKNTSDTADDEFFRRSFFSAPEGAGREMLVIKHENSWLIGNVHSPFSLCVNVNNEF